MTARCEPPEQWRGERWHWLTAPTGNLVIAGLSIEGWERVGTNRVCSPQELGDVGYRWHSVAKPGEKQ